MIKLRQVAKAYRSPAGEVAAVQDVDVDVGAGVIVALVGRSGSGKSTLLNLIGGIDRPSAGSVVVAGTALEALSEARLSLWRGKNVGFVFQFFQLLPTLTAAENVMLAMDFAGVVPVAERRPRALRLLDDVGLSAHADKLPATLSGGEQQRVAIARALANDPPVLLADEPTGNLDSTTAAAVFGLLRAQARLGKTIVVVTHDEAIARLTDRTLRLVDGRLATPVAPATAAAAVPA